MPLPEFAVGEQQIRTLVADPEHPARLFVTNGAVVMRSSDAGCSWSDVFAAGGAEFVMSIVVPGGDDRIYLLLGGGLQDRTEAVRDAPVVVSDDDGATWGRGAWSVPEGMISTGGPVGNPRDLAASPVDADTAFLLLSDRLFSTGDGGRTWEPVSNVVEPAGESSPFSDALPDARDLQVDPVDPQTLWVLAKGRLYRSTDGGRNWEVPQTHMTREHGVGMFEVAPAPGASSIYVFDGFEVSWSSDGGDTWDVIESRYLAEAASALQRNGEVAIIVHDSASRSRIVAHVDGEWLQIKAPGPTINVLAEGGIAASPLLYAASDPVRSTGWAGRLYAFAPPSGVSLRDLVSGTRIEPPPPPAGTTAHERCPIDTDVDADQDSLTAPDLAPTDTRVVLAPGGSRVVPYELSLSGASKADIYFLVDASGSMEKYLCAVAQDTADIAAALIDRGIDAWFGVGTYQHLVAGGNSNDCYSYFRWSDISPMNDAFFVPSKTCGGIEPQMSSLVQAATGSGQTGIEVGLQANFREDAVPVIVHISDEAQSIGPGHATIDEAIDALNSKDIRQVGFFPGEAEGVTRNEASESQHPLIWLRDIAHATGALGIDPVDCDGDGIVDVRSGDPLVCTYLPSDEGGPVPLADAVTNMILALKDEAPVRLTESTKSGVVEAIAPGLYPAIDLRNDRVLDFRVTYSCSFDQAGQTFPVRLTAEVGSGAVASAEATVVCSAPPLLTVPPPLALAVPPMAVTVAPVPGPAPAPVPAPGSAPAPAPAPHANPVAVAQRQSQPQLATVLAGQKVQNQLALENVMVRVHDKHTPVEAINFTLIAGGLSLVAMFGFATALKARPQADAIRSTSHER